MFTIDYSVAQQAASSHRASWDVSHFSDLTCKISFGKWLSDLARSKQWGNDSRAILAVGTTARPPSNQATRSKKDGL